MFPATVGTPHSRAQSNVQTCFGRRVGQVSPQPPKGSIQAWHPPSAALKLRRRKCSVVVRAATAEIVRENQGQPAHEAGIYSGVPNIWEELAEKHGDILAVMDPHHSPATKLSYRELNVLIQQFAAGLAELGLTKGDKVSLFSENSARWLVADQSIMTLGAADAVRGSTSAAEEMAYILTKSDSIGAIFQDAATLERALPALTQQRSSNGNGASSAISKQLKFVVVLWGEASKASTTSLDCPVLSFNQVLAKAGDRHVRPVAMQGNDLATLVFTSGTTGSPKAVELTHANLAYQIRNLSHYIRVYPEERTLSLLPPWHIYERSAAYYILSQAATQVYTSIRKFKDDLTRYPPHYFVCVPLVLDSLHSKVMQQIKSGSKAKKALAGFFLAASGAYIRSRRIINGVALQYAVSPRPALALLKALITAALLFPFHKLGQVLVYKKIRQAIGIKTTVVSGGGSLASHLDDFFEILGLQVVNGWGLSETSPVLACRKEVPIENVRGTVGTAIPETSIRVVDADTLEDLPDGEKGLLLAKGPGIMRGYYNDKESTDKAMRAGNGWFDTGDIGWRAPGSVPGSRMAGNIILTGRQKDTIVLSNGENIEPQPIEDACCASAYISHMIVVGNDRRRLGALVAPTADAFKELEEVRGSLSEAEKNEVLKTEIRKVTSKRPARENIHSFVTLPGPLSPDDGTLTRTMKPRRQVILSKYKAELDRLYLLLK